MPDPWRYDGRTAVVTGCSSGIGRATCIELRALGATVTGLDVVAPEPGLVDRFLPTDLGDEGAVDAANERLGAVDALFNCAGITGTNPMPRVMAVNFLGLRHLSERVAAAMATGGSIVSVASIGGAGWQAQLPLIEELLAVDGWAAAIAWCERHPELFPRGAYGFSKQCIIAFTMTSAPALAGRGVRINAISPSVTDTPMLRDAAAIGGPAVVDAFPRPLGRTARADEQARAVVFLNSHAASYVTGANLWTDGGFLAGVTTGRVRDPLA